MLQITKPLRLFYNQAVDAFTFRETKSSNPIGQLMTMNVNAPVFSVTDFGAVLNVPDITMDQAVANFNAIQSLIDQLPDTGGQIYIPGCLQYYGTIQNPRRVFGQITDPRPIPFGILGYSNDAALVNLANSPAVAITGGYSFAWPSTVAKTELNGIAIYSKGVGLQVRGGGKEVIIRDLVIAGCEGPAALDIDGFDGGQINGLYCINNKNDGAMIANAHMCDLEITSRGNLGRGLVVRSCASWELWALLESNGGFGLDAEDLQDCRATLWQEANNGSVTGQYTPQGRLRRSQLTINGNVAQDRNLAFDTDGVSRLSTTIGGRIDSAKLAPYRLDLPWPAALANVRPYVSPIVSYSSDGKTLIDLTVKVGAYTNQPANISSNWIEIYGYDWYKPLTNRLIVVGDTVVVRVRIKPSSAAAAFFAAFAKQGKDVPAIKVNLSHAALAGGQQVYFHDAGELELEIVATATTTATDYLRVPLYVCPVALPMLAGPDGSPLPQPEAPHDISITGFDVYHIPA